jgi:ribose-phosphate pyrophosphokinase
MDKYIDVNQETGISKILFPDNQPHIRLTDIQEGDEVTVRCAITSALELLQLQMVSNALTHKSAHKKMLTIPYLMGARYDRIMMDGDSFDLELIANIINDMGFERVRIFDVHSDVALTLINHSESITNKALVETYTLNNAVLVCPDHGARKKIDQVFKWNPGFASIVYCEKNRNPETGKLTLEVIHPEECENRNCIIVDDICDGGATFIEIAKQIKPKHLTLMVSHGIFSKGFTSLEKYFDAIITSNSYKQAYEHRLVQLVPLTF